MICKICNKEYKDNGNLSKHIKLNHNLSYKEYYDNYIDLREHKCSFCGAELKWQRSFYQLTCGKKECKLKQYKITCKEKYGTEYSTQSLDVKTKIEKTKEVKYGNKNYNNVDKHKQTCLEKYGVSSYSKTENFRSRIKDCHNDPDYVKQMITTRKQNVKNGKYVYNGLHFDSGSEITLYKYFERHEADFVYQPDVVFWYEANGKKHAYHPDFLYNNTYYEVKNDAFFATGIYKTPWVEGLTPEQLDERDIRDTAKYKCMIDNNIVIILASEIENGEYIKRIPIIHKNDLWGKTKKQIVEFCKNSEFPGTLNWPKEHPIWKSYLPGKLSPKDAWNNIDCLNKAVNNLFWIINKSILSNKYESFIETHKKAFNTCKVDSDGKIISGDLLLKLVLNRFTIAKIAPKVTALKANMFFEFLEDQNIDLSNGVYCPMAGFGGIIEGTKRWFNKHGLDYTEKIEAFDINADFCKWYGWTQQDILKVNVVTDKTVVVCPPFGNKYEHWYDSTLEKNSDEEIYYRNVCNYTFNEWVSLIKEHIKAPNYIFFGPDISNDVKINTCSLFKHKHGIMMYSNI